jgi:hypothetical protein
MPIDYYLTGIRVQIVVFVGVFFFSLKSSAGEFKILCFLFSVHAAIIAINEAIDRENSEEIIAALQNPSALLFNLSGDSGNDYQALLFTAKKTKAEAARNKVNK